MTEWTDTMIGRLRELWDEGHSAQQIGNHMGVSKNSILGKVHRLDLPPRPSPIRVKGSGAQPGRSVPRPQSTLAPLPSMAHQTRPQPVLAPLVALARPAQRQPSRPPNPKPTRERFGKCCRPINDGRPWKYCEKPIETLGRQYCDACWDLTHVKMHRREADPPVPGTGVFVFARKTDGAG